VGLCSDLHVVDDDVIDEVVDSVMMSSHYVLMEEERIVIHA
jgi:hypothetical protein